MNIEVTIRHIEASSDLQGYAKRKAEELCEAFPKLEHVHVILDGEKHRKIAEVIAQGKNHTRVEADEASDNMQVSVDLAFEKAERQLRKLREKVQEKRQR